MIIVGVSQDFGGNTGHSAREVIGAALGAQSSSSVKWCPGRQSRQVVCVCCARMVALVLCVGHSQCQCMFLVQLGASSLPLLPLAFNSPSYS
jgi:hypothetical protein